MITITWQKLNEEAVFTALKKLAAATGLDGNTAYRVSRFCSEAQKAMNNAQVFQKALVDKYVFLEADGQPKRDDKGNFVFNSPTAYDEYRREFQDKMSTETVEIKVNKLSFNAVASLKILTPVELSAIEDYLDGVPDPEGDGGPSGLVLPPGLAGLR